jgi:hypothetical protein
MRFNKVGTYQALDLVEAYSQVPLDEETQRLFAISGPSGIFDSTRMMMGGPTPPASSIQWFANSSRSSRSTNRKVQNWSLRLSDFQFTIKQIPVKSNVVANALSRLYTDTPLFHPRAVLLSMTTRGRKKTLEITAATDANDKTKDEIAD